MPEHEQPEDQDQVQRSHIPNLEVFLQELYTERLSPEQLQAQALGLHQDDFMALVSPLEAPTTPIDPTNVFALGFGTEIGLAWQFQRPVGGRLVSMEVQRATVAAMTDAVSLGEYTGFFMVDDNKRAKWAASTTRYYQVRAVARSGETNYFSPWTPAVPVSGTTLAAGSSNSDLQTRMDTFAQAVQLRHLYAGVGDTSALSQAVSVLSQQVSILSQKVSVLSSLPAASVTSQEMSVADAALSARIDTQSQSVSVLSQAISVISQQVSAISHRLSALSTIAKDLGVSGNLSVLSTISVNRIWATSSLRLGSNSLDRWALDQLTGGFIAQVGTGYDFGSNAGPIKDLYVYGVLNFLNSATGATETTLAWTLSALRVSAASVFFTGDVKVSGNLSAPILDTLSNAISVLSQQVSVLSQSVSSQAAALSVRIDTQSQAVSVLSQGISVVSQALSSQAAALSVRIDTQSQSISALSQQTSVLSQGLSVVSNAVSVVSQALSVQAAALSVRVDTQSQAISVISQQVSILSQAHSVLSQRMSTLAGGAVSTYLMKSSLTDYDWKWVSITAGAVSATITSNALSVLSQAISVLSQQTSVLSQGISVVSQALSVQAAALSVRIDTQSQSVSVLSQQVSALSQAHSVLSQAVSVADAALSIRVDTQSQAISVLSQAVSALSQQVSILSQGLSVVSQAVSSLSQVVSVMAQVWRVQGLSAANNATSADSKYSMAAEAAIFYNPTTGRTARVISVVAVVNDTNLSATGGDNGRDQAVAFTASSWIHFYLVLDGATVKSRSSATAPPTGPTLQGTESAWAYVGAIRYDATPALVPTHIRGSRVFYRSAQPVLDGGSAVIETAMNVASFVPPNALDYELIFSVRYANATVNVENTLELRVVSGSTYLNTGFDVNAQVANISNYTNTAVVLPNVGQNFYYHWISNTGTRSVYIRLYAYSVANGGD